MTLMVVVVVLVTMVAVVKVGCSGAPCVNTAASDADIDAQLPHLADGGTETPAGQTNVTVLKSYRKLKIYS